MKQEQVAGKKIRDMAPKILREHRKTRRESQYHFWSRFGVTQSRGSRFEKGTEIPAPVAILLKLYLDGIITDGDLWRAKRRRAMKVEPPSANTEVRAGSAHSA